MAEVIRLKKSNCKNCYKCIRHCPVKSIKFSGNQAHIVGDECILCGQCFVICPQNAKEILDAREKVKVMLDSGDEVYVSLAPSFIANYEGVGIGAMREALVHLGFTDAEETAIGATIVKNEYEKLVASGTQDVIITTCCHSVNLLVQKHFPHLIHCLANVVSPMQAHARDIKRRHPDAKVVFVGPCISKKDEAEVCGDVDAVLTFEELSAMLKAADIIPKQELDSDLFSRARFFPITGGVLKTMKERDPDYTYMSVDGVENCISALREIERGNIHKTFIEMSACSGSCVGGPLMEKYHNSPIGNYQSVKRYAGREDFKISQPAGGELDKEFYSLSGVPGEPSEYEINEILRKMGKTKPEDELNCGTCGYNTCREKAVAIYRGKADISMCLPYLKERAETLSDNVINNSPNGILVLNEDLEVQSANPSALRLMNLRSVSDIMGEPVVRILDPAIFMEVKRTGLPVYRRRRYLAEYSRYVEQTVTYDKEFKILVCTMRDVTEEEKARESKESISRQTVETADKVVEKQMRIVQEIASLLGETVAETKIVLTKLKESISDE